MGTHYTNHGDAFLVDDEYDEVVAIHSWQRDKDGYVRRWDGTLHKECRLHRFIMNFPEGIVDHINRDVMDNRRENLRVVSHTHNRWNSGSKGVTQLKSGKWMARIMANGKRVTIGSAYRTREEAESAYAKAWEARAEGIT